MEKNKKYANYVKSTLSCVPYVPERFEEINPAIKFMLNLPGEKFTLGKPMEGSKIFLTYAIANMENGIDMVQLFREGDKL